jgi:hypothetical protein
MKHRPLTPYKLGPSAVPIDGREATVLIPTYAMPMVRCLAIAQAVTARGATPLLLRASNQPMPSMPEFLRIRKVRAELLSIDVRIAEEPSSDEELLAAVAKAIKDCQPISSAPPPKLAKGRSAPGPQVPDLTDKERKQFLAAIYSPRRIDDGP